MLGFCKIAVIGGGAAGLMAAGRAAELGASVTLFEKNKMTGRKLLITGKGRCNLANACDIKTFISNIPTNPRFMYTAINNFTPEDSMAFFEGLGVPLKTERGNRVFPESDKSSDVVSALRKYCASNSVRVINATVKKIGKVGDSFVVETDRQSYFDKVIIATGGRSYPLTGSTGDGYLFARSFGIDVVPTRPSLVPLECEERYTASMQGLSLKNVAVTAFDENGRAVYRDFGEMLFTHFGVSGPVILSMSAHLSDIGKNKYKIFIDLKPALDEAMLDKRILSDFSKYSNKIFLNSLSDLLPSKMISVFVKLSGVSPLKKVNEITKKERLEIVKLMKAFPLTVKKTRPIDEAIITSGGVAVSEIDPRTMQSKKVEGLYFVGEVIDVDAYTGGFNLQIAFSTARLAAEKAIL